MGDYNGFTKISSILGDSWRFLRLIALSKTKTQSLLIASPAKNL